MRPTPHGNLAGSFEASGFGLFVRGVPMWLMVFAPLAFAVDGFTGAVDWKTRFRRNAGPGRRRCHEQDRGGNPGLWAVPISFAMLMCGAISCSPHCSIRHFRP